MANYKIAFILSILTSQTYAQEFWIEPPKVQVDLTQTFPNNVPLVVQWRGQPAASNIASTWDNDTTMSTLFDLHVTSFDAKSNFTSLIASNINLTSDGSVKWNVAIPQDQIDIDADWVLRFIASSGPYVNTGFPSNGFVIQQGSVATTTTSSTSSSTTSSPTSSNTQTIVPPPTNGDGGLSAGAKAAIGVVIPAVILAIAAGVWMFLRKRKGDGKKDEAGYMDGLEMDKSGELPPAYPVEMPNTWRPVELGDGGRHELQ